MAGHRKELIVTADDLGYCRSRDDGILQGFSKGAVTRASLLVNGESCEEAARKALEIGMPVGLHVNVTEGPPVNGTVLFQGGRKEAMDVLFDRSGRFETAVVDKEVLRNEILAQIEKFKQIVGFYPAYIDGHNHVQVSSMICDVLGPIMEEYKIDEIRIPREMWFSKTFVETLSDEKIKFYESIRDLAAHALEVYQKYGIKPSADSFIGISLMGNNLNMDSIAKSLFALPSDVNSCELMVHPGLVLNKSIESSKGTLRDFEQWHHLPDRQNELDVLCDQKLSAWVKDEFGFDFVSHITRTHKSPESYLQKREKPAECIALISSLAFATGNLITMKRISKNLNKLGFSTILLDPKMFTTFASMKSYLDHCGVEQIIGINAKRAGKWTSCLKDANYKTFLVIGGTDVNGLEQKGGTQEHREICNAFLNSNGIISFNATLRDSLQKHLNNYENQTENAIDKPLVHVIPQSFDPIDIERVKTMVPKPNILRSTFGLKDDAFLVVLPCGLRRVKDPLYIFETWDREIQQSDSELKQHDVTLVIVGPKLDPGFSQQVLRRVADAPFVHYHEPVPHEVCLKILREADVVLNTSIEEGMSTALLEAMALGKPVLARRNSGNCSLFNHEENGLLFDDPNDFIVQLKRLLSDANLRTRLSKAASQKAFSDFAPEVELSSYSKLFQLGVEN